ncbi:hypothetical protein BV898_03439 [Hypsibius exemplaris]|uniref:Uncharacterized protein n=1 Tax=Hypsibius exemplaris TaxID=2072580 RepID=A0A1W0X5G5_HYPEX|nr:hypothetical protein BV898_03439 [Hypsibius exemplaris]
MSDGHHGNTEVVQQFNPIIIGPLRLPEFRNARTNEFPDQTFRAGHYNLSRVKEGGLNLHRYYGGAASEYGQYWMLDKPPTPTGTLASRLDSAILPSWNNQMNSAATLHVPAGVLLMEGYAASQKDQRSHFLGGGWQIFIPQPILGPLIKFKESMASKNLVQAHRDLEETQTAQRALLERYTSHLQQADEAYLRAFTSDTSTCTNLLRNGNELRGLSYQDRQMLQQESHSLSDKSGKPPLAGRYKVHSQTITLPSGQSVSLSLHVSLRHTGDTTRTYMQGNTRVTETTQHYTRVFEWS